MRKLFLAPLCGALLALGACANPQVQAKVDVSVQATEIALTDAFKLATIYTSLPRCGTAAVSLCSDAATVAKIKSLATTAHDAMVMARKDAAFLGAALTAISTFRNAIPS